MTTSDLAVEPITYSVHLGLGLAWLGETDDAEAPFASGSIVNAVESPNPSRTPGDAH